MIEPSLAKTRIAKKATGKSRASVSHCCKCKSTYASALAVVDNVHRAAGTVSNRSGSRAQTFRSKLMEIKSERIVSILSSECFGAVLLSDLLRQIEGSDGRRRELGNRRVVRSAERRMSRQINCDFGVLKCSGTPWAPGLLDAGILKGNVL